MKFHIESLMIKTREDVFTIPFSKKITYYYGQTSVGKSTILRLIDWCLGAEDIEKTEEIIAKFLGAKLSIVIEGKKLTLERDLHENEIAIDYIENKEEVSKKFPIHEKEFPIIPNSEIYTISDFLFYCGGIIPPHIKRSSDFEGGLERISFRSIMWYCYLKQEQMVNSLFYLESPESYFKHKKSRETLKYLLEYNVDKVAELEVKLTHIQEQKTGNENTIHELAKFLTEYDIEDYALLKDQRENHIKKIEKLNAELADVRHSLKTKNYDSILELRKHRQSILVYLEKIVEEINNVDKRLEQQEELRGEYVSASSKIIRTFTARDFFKDLHFQTCPKCGQKVEQEQEKEQCSLCKQEQDKKRIFDARKTDIDLTKRISELDEWIKRLTYEKTKLRNKQQRTLEEKYKIDVELDELSQISDSQYLANARILEQQKFQQESKIEFIDKMIPMLLKINKLKEDVKGYDIQLASLKSQIKLEREEIRKTNQNLIRLGEIFKDVLVKVKFQDFNKEDGILIDPFTLFPRIIKSGTKIRTLTDFNNMGSAGKKNIFKSCYAIAIHILSVQIHGRLPSMLMIDTPMQHINEELDEELFRSYYDFIYSVVNNELKGHQLILIDKKDFRQVTGISAKQFNFKEPSEDEITLRLLSKDDPNFPPLF